MYDLIIHNGRIVSASSTSDTSVWIGITGEKIITLATGPPPFDECEQAIDAGGAFVTPGGIDSHVHLEQLQIAPGEDTGDTFYSGTRSAIAGGTTTIIAFANQQRHDESLLPLVEEYHRRAAARTTYTDYSFHMILTKPSKKILDEELPVLFEREGITSIKVYMTYEARRVSDRDMLEILIRTRKLGMTLMVHAENDDMVQLVIDHLKDNNLTEPYHHAIARIPGAEAEATNRAICLSNLISAPILIVHVSSAVSMARIRQAQNEMEPIYAETCPQYLLKLADDMIPRGHGGCACLHTDISAVLDNAQLTGDVTSRFEGAKMVCSPPVREDPLDLDAVWKGLTNGTVTTFSSDHCPSRFDHPKGKKKGLVDGQADFTKIPNGLAGVETRQPLLMTYGVEAGKITPERFVQVCCTLPAQLYGLQDRKGAIAPGMDADLVIWYPSGKVNEVITNDKLHHDIDHTVFEGTGVTNWPRYTILRGKVAWDRDGAGVVGDKGQGRYVKRTKGTIGHYPRKETVLDRIARISGKA